LIGHVTFITAVMIFGLSVYYNGAKQISMFQKIVKSTFYQKMKYGLLL